MKPMPPLALRKRFFRRLILSTSILPAAFAGSAFAAAVTWNGPVALNTGDPGGDDATVTGNATVTLTNTGPASLTENSITFSPSGAAETLTVNGAGLQLRSTATVLGATSSKTITINGTADFAPGELFTGPSVGTSTNTAETLIKNGGAGTLILDDTSGQSALANATLEVFDGTLSVVGTGGINPLSTLTSQIVIGSSGTQSPVLEVGASDATNTTFNNSFKASNSGTLLHNASTTDTFGGAGSLNPVATGKTLTIDVEAGELILNGSTGSTLSANTVGGSIKKVGIAPLQLGALVGGTAQGSFFIANLNVAAGRVDAVGRFRTTSSPTIAAGSVLSLSNTSSATPNSLPATTSIPTGTLEGVPGAFGTTTLNLTGGTLGLGLGGTVPGLSAHLYGTGWNAAQAAFGGPVNPNNTYATYTSYFASIGAGILTSTGANPAANINAGALVFGDPNQGGYGNTAMYASIAPINQPYTNTDNIVSRFDGKISIGTAGTYTFGTTSDDGSMLYIDGVQIVANNASQGMTRRTGTINLTPGLHNIDIGYYEGGGLNGLVVDYSGPDTSDTQTNIPDSVLVPTDTAAFTNAVTVTANSSINTTGATVPSTGLSAGKSLDVTGYRLGLGTLALGSAGTYTVNANTPNGVVYASNVTDTGGVIALVNNGPGALVLASGASAQLQTAGSSVSVTGGGALGVVLGGAGGSPTGNATVNVNGQSLILSSSGGDQSYAPVGLNFSNGGNLTAEQIGTGVAGTTATPIRTTLTTPLTINSGKSLNTSTFDNYILVLPALSGAGTLSVGGTVETSGAINNLGAINVIDGASFTSTVNISTTSGVTVSGASIASRLALNGGVLSGGPLTVNNGATVSLGADDVLGGLTGGVSSVTINEGGTVSAAAGTHSTLPTLNLSGGTLTAAGPGDAPAGTTLNYILNGNVNTTASDTAATISAPSIQLRGPGVAGPVTFNVARGTAATDLAISSSVSDGGAGLIKTGSGIMLLSRASTYTGPTVVNAGTLIAGNSASLGTSPVTLKTGGILSLVLPPAVGGFSGFSLNGGAVADATNNILTLTDNVGGEARSAFTLSQVPLTNGFSANFVYTAGGDKAADGSTFTIQGAGSTVVGGGGGSLGYVGIAKSAAIELNIYNGHILGTAFAIGSVGTYISSNPVNLGSGDPISVSLVYDPTALTIAETLTDQTTAATYSNTFTVPDLTTIVGGSSAYIGFTGATGGAQSTQTVSNFRFSTSTLPQTIVLPNNITIPASTNGGLDVPAQGPGAAGSATLTGTLTLNSASVLNVTGGATPTDLAYTLAVTTPTVLAGNSTINVADNGLGTGELKLAGVSQSAGGTTLTKLGAGILELSGTLNVTTLNANEGTTILDGALNANSVINDNGAKVDINADESISSLVIGAGGVVELGSLAPTPQVAAAVPEPGALTLLLGGITALLARRRRA